MSFSMLPLQAYGINFDKTALDDTPDCCEQFSNALLYPFHRVAGVEIRVIKQEEQYCYFQEQKRVSVEEKVALLAIVCLMSPLSVPLLATGVALRSMSQTYSASYKEYCSGGRLVRLNDWL